MSNDKEQYISKMDCVFDSNQVATDLLDKCRTELGLLPVGDKEITKLLSEIDDFFERPSIKISQLLNNGNLWIA